MKLYYKIPFAVLDVCDSDYPDDPKEFVGATRARLREMGRKGFKVIHGTDTRILNELDRLEGDVTNPACIEYKAKINDERKALLEEYKAKQSARVPGYGDEMPENMPRVLFTSVADGSSRFVSIGERVLVYGSSKKPTTCRPTSVADAEMLRDWLDEWISKQPKTHNPETDIEL